MRRVRALLRPGGLECLPYAVGLSMCPAAPGRLLRHLHAHPRVVPQPRKPLRTRVFAPACSATIPPLRLIACATKSSGHHVFGIMS